MIIKELFDFGNEITIEITAEDRNHIFFANCRVRPLHKNVDLKRKIRLTIIT